MLFAQRLDEEATDGDGRSQLPFVVAAEGHHLRQALNEKLVLATNTAHVLRFKKTDVLALNKANVLRLDIRVGPMFTDNASSQCIQCIQAMHPAHPGDASTPPRQCI